jgi:hypothetical protein
MKEEEAVKYVHEWIKMNRFKENEEFYFGGDNPKAKPDFLIDYPRKMMIEVKGSHFSMTRLIGQIVYYLLSFRRRKLIVAVPERVEELRLLRQKLMRHGFKFEILDISNLEYFS